MDIVHNMIMNTIMNNNGDDSQSQSQPQTRHTASVSDVSGSEADTEYDAAIPAPTNGGAPASSGFAPDRLHQIIDTVVSRYRGNDALLSKFSSLVLQLPTVLSNYETILQERTERKNALSTTAEEFIEQFLTDDTNKYYYNSAVDLFFVYNTNTMKYEITEEDEITQVTLLALNEYEDLKPWKYRIKNQILKRIKEEKELLNAVPEPYTIQKVLSLFIPNVFKSRDAVKHFLIILGDIFYKKNVNRYFITSKAKRFIKELSSECSALFGMHGMAGVFKYKFYEHTFNECRLLDMNDAGLSTLNVGDYSSPFKRNIVEIMCVASYYSKRFKNADAFLESQYCKDSVLHSHCLYLKLNDEAAIINRFIATSTNPCNNSQYFITWKKMHFLWKLFLEEERLPYIIFTNQLKTRLMALLPHTVVQPPSPQNAVDGVDVIFTSVTSKNTNLNMEMQISGGDVFSE